MTIHLIARYGALGAYSTWKRKTLAAFKEIGLSATHSYEEEVFEVSGSALWCGAPTAVLCGLEDDAAALLRVTGLDEWDDANGMEKLWSAYATGD